MSAGMPELGSKISLISKADIRYEGRLFTVDPQECTIALANVKSFGTEDRETQFPVAPQNQVYEYILFRGSDIKDIRVVTNVSSMPNDPAIVQMTVQPPMGQQSFQPQTGFGHPVMSQITAMSGQFGSPYGMTIGGMSSMMSVGSVQNRQPLAKQSELGLVTTVEPRSVKLSNSQTVAGVDNMLKDQSLEDGVLDIISGGSRSATPTSLMRKSPTIDQGVQVGQHQSQPHTVGKLGDKQNLKTAQAPYKDRDSHGRASGLSQYSEGKQRELKDVSAQNQNHRGLSAPGNQGGGWMNQRSQIRGARGGLTGPSGSRGGRGTFRLQQSSGPKPKNTLKFDNDYDFEQANTEFEELRSQLAKTKIDAGVENEKKDDSGNETGAGDNEPEEESEIVHYDKTKSFFDNISCEAVERSKGRSQRTDWRTERKLNSETFGVSSMRRGGFRGGRGYYNRGNVGNNMYRNNQGSNSQNFRSGFRGQRSGGQRKMLSNPNQHVSGNSQSNLVSTSVNNQSSRNNLTTNNSNVAEGVNSNVNNSTSSSQTQQNNRLVTSNA